MFVNTSENGIHFTDADYRTHFISWLSIEDGMTPKYRSFLSRMLAGEPVVFTNWSDMNQHNALRDATETTMDATQARCMAPLRSLLQVSTSELAKALRGCHGWPWAIPEVYARHAALAWDAAGDGTNRYSGSWCNDYPELGWTARSAALAVLTGWDLLASVPVPVALGYSGKTVTRMEPTAHEDWETIGSVPGRNCALDAQKAAMSLAEHLNIAAKCALDTPQEITVDVFRGQYKQVIKVRAERIGPIRGLMLELPTGGRVFYRNIRLDSATGELMIEGRKVPKRKILLNVLARTALDVVIHRAYADRFSVASDVPLAVANNW